MKRWNVNCLGSLKPKMFLDTNILSYLVDETYPALNELIETLKETCVFDIISSDFCKNEFVGIRKREHYLRIAVQESQKNMKSLNFSSLLKYHNQFGAVEVNFQDIIGTIKKHVDADIETIITNYDIDFCCHLHPDLTYLANDVCLNSKISKEDSMVIASSTNPESGVIFKHVILLTHDSDFNAWHEEAKSQIQSIFKKYLSVGPTIFDSRKVFGLDIEHGKFDRSCLLEKIRSWFKEQFADCYIGKTISVTDPEKNRMFALKASLDKPVKQNKYLFVLSCCLDFMYVIPNKVQFWHKNKPVEDKTAFTKANDNIITACFMEYDTESFVSRDIYDDILQEIRKENHLIFYLPETI